MYRLLRLRVRYFIFLTGAVLLTAPAAATQPASTVSDPIRLGGSNTMEPFFQILLSTASQTMPGLSTYAQFSGTGDGFRGLAAGELDLSAASRPIQTAELQAVNGEIYELPVAFDQILVFVSKENDWVDHLTGDELHTIFLQGAKTWKDVRDDWPDLPIRAESPEPGSGTADALVSFIGGDDALASSVRRNSGHLEAVHRVGVSVDAVGFASASYRGATDAVRSVPIDLGDGPVAFDEVALESSYPLGRPLFIYVSASSAQRREVAEFVDYVLKHAAEAAKATGLSPLPDSVRETTDQRWSDRALGSVLALGTEQTSEVYGGGS